MKTVLASEHTLKEPSGLSDRIQWLRDYYFRGTERPWNNEFTSWTTGTPWDIIYNETDLLYCAGVLYAAQHAGRFLSSGGQTRGASSGFLAVVAGTSGARGL
ncbi:MAG: hypothetical protein MZV70_15475 [Desulfobacterales bacterium]|nr:hypothetical protein [Desulfobacterales bacterium]